jgi:hypothetical protein
MLVGFSGSLFITRAYCRDESVSDRQRRARVSQCRGEAIHLENES